MKKRLFSWLVIASMMFTMGMIMASADGLTVTSYAVERSVLVFNLSENASGITAVLTEVEGTPVPISETQVEGSKITIKPTEKLDISKKYSIILKNNETEIANYHISFNTIWEDDFSDAEKFKTYVNYDLKDDVNTTENAHSLENGKLAIRYSNNGKAFGKQFPVSSKGFDIVTEMTVSNSNLNSPGALYFLDVMLGDGMSESEDWFRFLAPNPREDNAVVANYRLLNQPSDVNTTYGNAAKSNMDVMYKMTYNGAGTQTDDYFKLEINGSKFVEMYGDYRDFSNYTFAVRAANDSCASVPTYIDDLIIYSINVVDMNNYVPISVIGFDATKEAATFTFNKSVDITSVDVTSNSEFVDVTSKYIGNDVVIKPTEGNFGTDSIYNVNLTVTDGIKESTNSYLVVFDELWNDDFSDAEKFATYGNYDLKDDTNITENAYALENGRLALRYKNNDGKSLYKKFPVSESGFDIITEMKVDGTNNDKSSSYFLDILLDEALSDGSNWMRLLKPGAEDGAVMTNLNVLGSERISSPVGVSAKTQVSNIKYRMKYAGVGDTENDYFSLDINGNKYEYTGDYGKDFKEYAIGLRTNNNDEENPTYIDDLLIYSINIVDMDNYVAYSMTEQTADKNGVTLTYDRAVTVTSATAELNGEAVPVTATVNGTKVTVKNADGSSFDTNGSYVFNVSVTDGAVPLKNEVKVTFCEFLKDDFETVTTETLSSVYTSGLIGGADDDVVDTSLFTVENGKLKIGPKDTVKNESGENVEKRISKKFNIPEGAVKVITEMDVSLDYTEERQYFFTRFFTSGFDWDNFYRINYDGTNFQQDNVIWGNNINNWHLIGGLSKDGFHYKDTMTFDENGNGKFVVNVGGTDMADATTTNSAYRNNAFGFHNNSTATTYLDNILVYAVKMGDVQAKPISITKADATKESMSFTFDRNVGIKDVNVKLNNSAISVKTEIKENELTVKPISGYFDTDSSYVVNISATDGIISYNKKYSVVFDELWNDDFSDAEKFKTYGNYDLKDDDVNTEANAYALENGRLALRYKNNDGKSLYKKFPVSESGFDIITEMKVDGTNNDKSSSYFLDILLDEALSDGSNWMRLLKPGAEDGAVMTNLNVLGSERISSPVGVSAKTQVSNIKYRMKYAGVGDTENDYFSLDINGNKYEYTGDYGKDFKEYAIGLRTNNNDEENPTYIDDLLIYSVEVTDITSALNTAESFRIDGEVKPGDTLTCVNDNPASLPDICQIDYEYKWYKNSENSADFDTWKLLDNSEATDKSVYVVKEDDKDDYIVCIVTPKLTILPTGQEITLLDINTPVVCKKSSPEIKDEKIEYNKDTNSVTASMFYYDFNYDDGATDFVWEVYKDGVWEVVKSTSDVESKFGEKVEDTYVITAENTGKDIRCKMTVKNTADFGYEESTLAARTKNLSLTAPVIKGDVTISGNSSVGSVLSASYEYYDADNDEEDATVWEWYRVGKNEKTPVGNALNYSVSSQDCGYEIVLEITPKSKAYPYDGITYVSDGLKIPETKKPSYGGGSGSSGGGSGSSGGGSSVIRVPAPSNSAVNDNVYFKTSFKDISGHWAEKEIKQLEALGLVKGDGEKYNPDAIVKRAEWITMLTRAIGFKEAPYKDCFDDVKSSDWYSGIIQAAFDADLIDGDGSNFNPVNELTREALVKMMIDTYLYKKGVEIPDVTNTGFDDDSDISTWAKKYVSMASELGIMTGVTPTTFAPKKIATRAEAAVVLVRLLDALKN